MTQTSVRPAPARPGTSRVSTESRSSRGARERSARAGRRRWLLLVALLALVAIGTAANIGPLTHYRDAKARLDTVTAEVDGLKSEKAQLQGDLAKLSETGYLETLARQKLAYTRPGEDLYIVTGGADDPSGEAVIETTPGEGFPTQATPSVGGGISVALDPDQQTPAQNATSGSGEAGSTEEAGSIPAEDGEGFFEGIISAIRGLF